MINANHSTTMNQMEFLNYKPLTSNALTLDRTPAPKP
jgi:hypothetical protein